MATPTGPRLAGELERLRAETVRLGQQVGMLQAILDNTTAIVFVKDLQGRYVLVNRRYAELRGTDRDAMIGKTVYDFMPREQADLVHSHDDEVALAGAPREWEEQFTRDGESVTYLSARFPLRDGEGRPYAVCGMLTDISERKQAELEMAAELTGLRALVETSPVGVVVAEAEGDRVVTVNREAERILGIPHRPGWGMPQYQALFVRRHPDGRPFAEDEYPMFRALHQGETVRLEEVVYEFNDGRLVRALVNATPVYGDAGDILAAIATLQEIAEPQAPAALETPAEAKPAQTVDVDLGGQPVHLDYGVISERGQRRETNEDAVYCEPAGSQRVQDDGWLCAVADGMGGAAVGEVASKLAVETLVSSYYASLGGSGDLAAAMGRANGVIYETAQQNPRYGGMGTTLTAALIRDGRLTVAHVGDTRTYLVRDWGIRQLTSDHTWVAELVRAGALDPNHRKSLPISSVLTRTLGRDASTEVDLVEVELMPGDRVVLCSDGLSNTVDDWEIARTAAAEAPQAAARSLVGLARERGGGDDTTVVIVKLG